MGNYKINICCEVMIIFILNLNLKIFELIVEHDIVDLVI